MKYALSVLALFVCSTSYAAGWSQLAVPTGVDVERGNGIMVYGNFGNAGSCTVTDQVYVRSTHPQYKEVYSAILLAFSTGKQLRFHIASCDAVTWYSAPTVTYNIMEPGGALFMRH